MDAAERLRQLVDELVLERFGPGPLEPGRPPWPVETALRARRDESAEVAEPRQRPHLTVLDGGEAA